MPIGNLFSTDLVFAHDEKRKSVTTLPPCVVTDLLTEPCSPKFTLNPNHARQGKKTAAVSQRDISKQCGSARVDSAAL